MIIGATLLSHEVGGVVVTQGPVLNRPYTGYGGRAGG
jgi:hypothetical protein